MKPLLGASLTDEDWAIVIRNFKGSSDRWWHAWWYPTQRADRRDADLILHAQRHKIVAVVMRTDDGSRIDLRLGTGISVGHMGIRFPLR